ncbi:MULTISPECIES: restriction endonuclease subunit S [Gammaproteobacteria]|uniref:restriction endonuclease subunit S n=1 Tax=Gammaproteobacteria TaxID=1236 RepID=UPI0018E44CB4|nr:MULTISPECIES: restriction endonuclease subunit S [Gammaproteobacteria]MBI6407242.1 restriction endonuclease subunit S [Proteus sp. PR00208]MCU8068922.1 restriction endonuclease subunit S [Shewanella sp. SM32]
MSHYKAYPEYKESGAEFIWNIPKDWELKRLRHVAIFNNSNVDKKSYEDQADVKLCNYTDVYYNEFITPDLEFMNATANESEIDKFRLAEGDVIITKDSEDPNDIGIPALVKQDMHDVVCGYHLTVIKSHEFDLSGFIHRSIQSHPTKAHFFVESPGITRYGLDQDAIGDIPVCIPPKEHRSTIVSAINTEINRINTLITKKTRFIELLKEKRQAQITHAVTKGLNPNVKMKDSRVEWIGDIPEHWEVKPFFSLLTELKRKNTGLVETNILSLSYGRVIQKSENRNMGLVPESYETYQIVEQGEVVFRFTDLQNDKRSLRSALVQERGIISSAYMAVSLRNIDSNYFSWLMRSYDLCKVFYGMGGGVRQSLKFEDVRRLQVLVPPKEEQAEIAAHVNRQLAHNDSLVEKTERSINLLKERRSAFITAAVTGQIDLRGEPV